MGILNGRVAIVTGSGSGIGQATALCLAAAGAKTVVVDLVPDAGQKTASMIAEQGNQSLFIETDVSNSENVAAMVKRVLDAYGKIDILHNNVGLGGAKAAMRRRRKIGIASSRSLSRVFIFAAGQLFR